MKKITKTICIVLLTLIMCFTGITASASEDLNKKENLVSPRLSHFGDVTFTFSATENGGYISISYYGYESFVKAEVTVEVQKRFLLVFWNDVGEWSSSSYETYGDFYHVFTLNGSGTYRANITFKVTGSDGTVDTIEKTIESKY